MKPPVFDYVRAESVDGALEALSRYGGDARLLAGGQSLMPLLNMRLIRPTALVDLNHVAGLDAITSDERHVHVGALVRHSAIERSADIGRSLPLLAQAARYIGDRQIRNRGTFGGSLAHADPTAELAVAAVALDATLQLRSVRGVRRVSAGEFFLGPLTTALGPDECLTGAVFARFDGWHTAFVEYARRHGDFAIIAMAAAAWRTPSGWEWRLALGGLTPRPVRAAAAERLLAETGPTAAALAEAAESIRAIAEPISDIRASAEYRLALIPVCLEEAVAGVLASREATSGGP